MPNISLEDWRNIATIIGTIIVLIVYITNSVHQHRQRELENMGRYLLAHQRLFTTPFILRNWKGIEEGTYQRNLQDKEVESEFSRLLGEVEYFALLHSTHAVSESMSIYMFGWWAQKLQPLLTVEERNNVYWQLAVRFLDEMKTAADDFFKMTNKQRQRYFKRRHFRH